MMFDSKTVNSDHEFLHLGDLIFYDAGAEGVGCSDFNCTFTKIR